MENHIESISQIIDYLDKVNEFLQVYDTPNREYELARTKLEEAVFWLTYGMENETNEEA